MLSGRTRRRRYLAKGGQAVQHRKGRSIRGNENPWPIKVGARSLVIAERGNQSGNADQTHAQVKKCSRRSHDDRLAFTLGEWTGGSAWCANVQHCSRNALHGKASCLDFWEPARQTHTQVKEREQDKDKAMG